MSTSEGSGLGVGAKAVLFGLGALVLLGFALAGALNARAISSGVETTAEVVDFEGGYRNSELLIRFTTRRGRTVETATMGSNGHGGANVGDEIAVVYDPDNPTLVAEKTGDYYVVPGVVAIVALALAARSLQLYLRWRPEPQGG